MLAVKATLSRLTFLLAIAGTMAAQSTGGKSRFLSVTFAIDGEKTNCPDLKVALRLHGSEIVPEQSDQGFVVPAVFHDMEHDSSRMDVNVTCGEYSLNFPDISPSWVSPGHWEFGVAYPPYWIERFGWTTAIERGTWVSYLESECNGCDPGVFTTVSHPVPPEKLVANLKHERPEASGKRARDISYALSVFGTEYERNRNYLLKVLNTCLSRPNDSPEDDVCDSQLLSFVTNLYWRGDSELLQPLLQIGDSRRDVIGEIGYFYGDLLERQPAAALNEMSTLSTEKQQSICALAGEDDFSINTPKLQRVAEHLRALGTDEAARCLKEAETKAGRTAK